MWETSITNFDLILTNIVVIRPTSGVYMRNVRRMHSYLVRIYSHTFAYTGRNAIGRNEVVQFLLRQRN